MENSLSSPESEQELMKKKEERRFRWKIKGFLFAVYFGFITLPLLYLSVEIAYSETVLGVFSLPKSSTRIILAILFFISALIGQYLVSFHILKMHADKILDIMALLLCILFAFAWNYDFQHEAAIYRLGSSNDFFNMIFIFLGIFLIILSLVLLSRPKYRFGFFLQTAGITMFANSFLLNLRMIEVPGYPLFLIGVIIMSIALFGYSIYYRVKFEYNFDKEY